MKKYFLSLILFISIFSITNLASAQGKAFNDKAFAIMLENSHKFTNDSGGKKRSVFTLISEWMLTNSSKDGTTILAVSTNHCKSTTDVNVHECVFQVVQSDRDENYKPKPNMSESGLIIQYKVDIKKSILVGGLKVNFAG